MAAPARRAARALAIIITLLLAALPSANIPAMAQGDSPLLSGAPGAVEATVTLGATLDVPITLRNDSAAPVTPRLFEALKPAAQLASAPAGEARAPLPRSGARVDPRLTADLAASADGQATFLVFLADQADLAAAYGIAGWSARGEYVARTLRQHAEAAQQGLLSELESRGLHHTPFWIVNAVAVRGDAADVAAIAARAEVAELRANRTASLGSPPAAGAQQSSPVCAPDAANVCWNIARVGASRVWSEFGVRGAGITVANIDSGVRFNHPALIGQYRGNSGGVIDHNYNWFDVYGDSPTPVDSGNHGTHTMGTMVATAGGAAQPAVGVAPGASWMAVRACSSRECSEVDLMLAAQWLLAPTDLNGDNPRPDLRPHVINNSWTAGQNVTWYAGYTAAWRAAGIYPLFAAGNTGNSVACGTIQSPGDYADVTAVGALDSTDRLASFSSVGPGPNGRLKPDLTAPGSGVWSTVADTSRVYGSNSGTSMATPHVAGAVALLWSANPSLVGDYDATYAALTAAAAPLSGDPRYQDAAHAACQSSGVPNNVYGYGRLDAYGAVSRVTVDVPWLILPAQDEPSLAPGASSTVSLIIDARRVPGPGVYEARVLVHGPDLGRTPLVVPITLTVPSDPNHAVISGRVTRAVDGAPVSAMLQVAGGAAVRADAQGRYSVTLPPATAPYTLTAAARDYQAAPATVQLDPAERATLDFALEADLPRLEAETGPRSVELDFAQRLTLPLELRNGGSRPLSYTVSLLTDHFGVWRSDEPDGPAVAWTEPPADAVTIPLEDDGASAPLPLGFRFPYRGERYERVYVSANGLISLEPLPPDGVPFARSCLPASETSGAAIVPLRLDLDPSKPGARVSYASLPEGFLLTWENVPLYNDSAARLSFQTLLMADGRISMRYRTISPLSSAESASYGLQYGLREVQALGCKGDLGLYSGLTIELRPQVPTPLWMQPAAPGGMVPAGETSALNLELRWAPTAPAGWPLSGAVVIQTNDPLRPEARLTVRLRTSLAPHRLYFPHAPGYEGS
jgi:subtilisin family serine protease